MTNDDKSAPVGMGPTRLNEKARRCWRDVAVFLETRAARTDDDGFGYHADAYRVAADAVRAALAAPPAQPVTEPTDTAQAVAHTVANEFLKAAEGAERDGDLKTGEILREQFRGAMSVAARLMCAASAQPVREQGEVVRLRAALKEIRDRGTMDDEDTRIAAIALASAPEREVARAIVARLANTTNGLEESAVLRELEEWRVSVAQQPPAVLPPELPPCICDTFEPGVHRTLCERYVAPVPAVLSVETPPRCECWHIETPRGMHEARCPLVKQPSPTAGPGSTWIQCKAQGMGPHCHAAQFDVQDCVTTGVCRYVGKTVPPPSTGERAGCTCGTPSTVHDVACPSAAPPRKTPGELAREWLAKLDEILTAKDGDDRTDEDATAEGIAFLEQAITADRGGR